MPSCIALLLPDSIFPLGFFLFLIAGHNNQLKKKKRERETVFLGLLFFPGKQQQPLLNLPTSARS